MFVELALVGGVSLTYLKYEDMKFKRKWKQIINSGGWFTNKLGKSLKLWNIEKTDYGFDLKVELPYSYTFSDLEKDLPIFKEGLGIENIELSQKGNMCYMNCVINKEFSEFAPFPLPPNKLLIAEGLNEKIIVDMNSFPHMLIGGSTGTGKSRLLFCILSNLIATTDQAEIHLLQVRKNDLQVFSNCRQVKTSSKTIEEVRDALKEIDEECKRREVLINPLKGYYSIADYNKENTKLKYIYTVIEEFSFLQRSGGDTKTEDQIKKECLKYIKTIVNVGRSSGVFLITALQKPTADSIPSDIKAQLTTRISMKITDAPASQVILGNDKATSLKARQLIVKTLDEQIAYSYTIDHSLIMENIKTTIIEKPKQVQKKKINKNIESLVKLSEID